MEVIPSRVFNLLFIYLDIAWLLALLVILLVFKRYQAVIAGVIGGLIYFLVDYGIFYLLLGTRVVEGADVVWLLLWLSISYGFTNFAWIWLWLDRDGHAISWSALIISGWLAVAFLSQNFGGSFADVIIYRGTGSYHGVMALLLVIGYGILVIKNLRSKEKKINIAWILAIGILVQFSWEAVLLISGIREPSITPLIVNSLIETNMGLPFLFLIHRSVTSRYDEGLKKVNRIA